ncbi:hypothetical protein ACVWWG_006045 [Bradyrhizobium sp. LB7.2]
MARQLGVVRRRRQRDTAAGVGRSTNIDRLGENLRSVDDADGRRVDLDIDGVADGMSLGGVEVAGIDHRMRGQRDRMVGLNQIGAAGAERRDGVGDGRVPKGYANVALAHVADHHIGRVDQQRAGLTVGRGKVDGNTAAHVDDAVSAQLDQTRVARLRAGTDLGAALDGHVIAGLDENAAGIRSLARRAQPRILAQLGLVAGHNGDVARRRALAACRQPPVHGGVVDGADVNRAIAHGNRRGAAQPLRIDRGGKFGSVIEIGDVALACTAADEDVLPCQADTVLGVDPAVNTDIAVRRDRERPRHQIADRRAVDLASRADQAVGELARRRRDAEAADIDRAAAADHETLGIGEIDVTADRTVHVGVQCAVDVDRSVANDIDEILRSGRQLQIDGVALPDAELRERVEGVVAGHCRRRDVGYAAGGLKAGPGAAVRRDHVRRLRLKADAEHRQEDHLHRTEQ